MSYINEDGGDCFTEESTRVAPMFLDRLVKHRSGRLLKSEGDLTSAAGTSTEPSGRRRYAGRSFVVIAFCCLATSFVVAVALKYGARPVISYAIPESVASPRSGPHLANAVKRDDGQPNPLPPNLPTLAVASRSDLLSISGLCHVLLVGLGQTGLSEPRTGLDALRLLTDERLAKATFGKSPFIRTRNGLRYRLAGSLGDRASKVGESHRDLCLCTFANLKLSLDEPITLESESLHLRDLLSESIANFTFDQRELSWAAEAYAYYLPPAKSWTDRFGKRTTFSQLLQQLMTRGFKGQSCGGLHVLRAVVIIINADNQHGLLEASVRAQADEFLKNAVTNLTANQRADGSWDSAWNRSAVASGTVSDSIEFKLVATGHMLEILHELESPPPNEFFLRSARWLLDTLASAGSARNRISICPLAHAIRAVRISFANPALANALAELVPNDRITNSPIGERR